MTPTTALAIPTILVIEDYADTRLLLSELFRRKGYNVVEADSGVAGIAEARGTQPDLIIMDLALPEMDGIEAARRIHALPGLAATPIIVLSAYLTADVENEVIAAGCVEMFPKPFDAESLLESVAVTLNAAY